MKGKAMKKILGFTLSLLAATCLWAGSAAAVALSLSAEELNLTMPDTTLVKMWGLKETTDLRTTWEVPVFSVTLPDTLVITLTNNLPADGASDLAKPTSLMIPGLQPTTMVPTWTDGSTGNRYADPQNPQPAELAKRVRSLTNEASNGGGQAVYTWNNLKPGTYLIQSATHQAVQVQMGLFAVLKVLPATAGQVYEATATMPAGKLAYTTDTTLVFSEVDPALHTAVATDNYGPNQTPDTVPGDYTSTMDYNPTYYLVNGQPYASGTPAINIGTSTDKALLRFVNAGLKTKIPILQGVYMTVVGEDGNALPYPLDQYSLEMPAGKAKEVIISNPDIPNIAIHDARGSLTNAGVSGGGMLANLSVNFTAMTLLTPNGGEAFVGGSDVGVQWTAPAGAASYLIKRSLDNGVTWKTAKNNHAGTSYLWRVPNTPTTTALIKVFARNAGGSIFVGDASDAVFSIVKAPQVLSPNGGETFYGGAVATIRWIAHPGAASYRLRYSKDNGATWRGIGNNLTGTSFDWTVPNVSSSQFLINLDAKNAGGTIIASDVSDVVFTTVQTPRVVAPNGGEVLKGGTSTTVKWKAVVGAARYDVNVSTDGGTTWAQAGTGITATSFTMPLPNTGTNSALVRVDAKDLGNALIGSDQSDASFTINQVAQVLTPNGGETLTAGITTTITWESLPFGVKYIVRYSTDGGATWKRLGSYTGTSLIWTVPAVATGNGLIKVTVKDFSGNVISNDKSDNPFTIVVL